MTIEERIFNQAKNGTAVNPGLPATLSSLLIAQAAHETADFTSPFFRNYNNAFGYSYIPGARYQVGPGSLADNGTPIAVYNSLEDSVKEIIDWIYRRVADGKFPKDLSTITTPEQYATLLRNSGYFTDSATNYAAGIRSFFIQVMQDLEKPQAKVILLIVFSLAGYWLYKRRK